MSEESRLGREAIETAYALKQLLQAGVRVWFYLEGRERTLDSPTDKLLMSVTAFADELEREKARQRTYDAMLRKAKAGHVTGGRVFGYDNVEIANADGSGSHVERRINETEAVVVRRIFDLCAAGYGLTRLTKTLNTEGHAAPRAQQGRPQGWAPSSVRAVLLRPLYAGQVVWNQTRKRDAWGRTRRSDRPETERITVECPELQIVSDDLWRAAQARFLDRREQYAQGQRPERVSRYLLAGFARCACCGGGFAGHSRAHGQTRRHFYGCTSHWKRGAAVCTNNLVARTDALDEEVLATLAGDVLRPSVVEHAIALALEELRPEKQDAQRDTLVRDLDAAREESARLAEAIGKGGPLDALVARLAAVEARRRDLEEALRASAAGSSPVLPRAGLERRLRTMLGDWKALLLGELPQARDVLRTLLVGPLRFTPVVDERRRGYRFEGAVALDRLVAGVVELPTGVVSPTGFEPVFQP
jgi:site-specific DNA recombinase